MSDTPPPDSPTGAVAQPKKRWRAVWRYALQLGALILLIMLLRLWQQRGVVSGPAPAINATLLDGRMARAVVQDGRPLLVHFWASWCPICRLEQDNIESLAQSFPTLTVAMQSGTAEEVAQHLHKQNLNFAVVNDPDGNIAARWGVRAVPSSFIIDADGRIRFVEVGYSTGIGLRLRLWWAGLS